MTPSTGDDEELTPQSWNGLVDAEVGVEGLKGLAVSTLTGCRDCVQSRNWPVTDVSASGLRHLTTVLMGYTFRI